VFLGDRRGARVDRERRVAQLGGALRTDQLDRALERDVLVVLAHRRLVCGGEDRLRQPVAVLKS
jgi:hypothetical protein